MSDSFHDPKLDQFLEQGEVDTHALGDLQRKIEADDPWKLPCPEALRDNQFVIHEHVRFMKIKRGYDIRHPESGQTTIECREPKIGMLDRMSRLSRHSTFSGFEFAFRDKLDHIIMRIKYKQSLKTMDDRRRVFNQKDQPLGVVSVYSDHARTGGTLDDNRYKPLASVEGTKREYSISRSNQVVARVKREWSGLIKEVLTKSNIYSLEFTPELPAEDPLRILILATVICADVSLDVSSENPGD